MAQGSIPVVSIYKKNVMNGIKNQKKKGSLLTKLNSNK